MTVLSRSKNAASTTSTISVKSFVETLVHCHRGYVRSTFRGAHRRSSGSPVLWDPRSFPSGSFVAPREGHVVVCCWSVKGGVGTTVVATALAMVLARAAPAGALLVDLAGDARAVAGLPDDPDAPGVAEWLREGPGVPADGLGRL